MACFEMDKHNVLEVGNETIALFFGKKKVFIGKKKISILPHPTEKYKCVCYVAKWLYMKNDLPIYLRERVKFGILRQEATEDDLLSINFS